MAVTGLALIGFLLGHLAGNLLVFKGQDAMNAYAEGLKNLGALLWVARGGLLLMFVVHVITGVSLTMQNKRARPEKYRFSKTIQASLASRTMHLSGLTILAFLLFHLAHYTLGLVQPEYFASVDASGRHDVYNMLIHGFQNPIYSGLYIAAMLVLAMHLSHGLPSLFQSLGWNSPRFQGIYKRAGLALAALLFLGFSSIPTAVWIGYLRLQ